MIRLDAGGVSWRGWLLSKYGRAKEWRLIDPAGTCYTADEIRLLRPQVADLDFLQARVRELEGLVAAQSAYFDQHELVILHRATAILSRSLPSIRLRLSAAS